MEEKTRWRRGLLEGLVIVTSILLAFGIEAAWEGRAEASRRSAVVEGLRSDFEAARNDLDRVTAFHRSGRSAAEALMHLGVDGPLPVEQAQLADSLVAEVLLGGSFDPPLGTLQSLISSGDLDLVGDTELTVLLTGFPSLVADLDREQEMMRRVMLDLHRYLISEGIGSEMMLTKGEPSWTIASSSVFSVVHTAGFRSWVGLLWAVFDNTTQDHEDLNASLLAIESRLVTLR